MNLKPLNDRVIVKPDASEDKTANGIYLPESAKEKPQTGKIVSVGPGKLNDDGSRTALAVKKGNKVIYGTYSGTEIEVGGKPHVIMHEGELLGIIE